MKLIRWFGILVLVCAASLAENPCKAQVTEGSLTGTVIDPSGAPIAGAKVVVTNVSTGETRSLVTDENGIYRVGFLQPGRYSVTGEHEGFDKIVVQGVQVTAATVTRADVQMKVGSVQNTVEVSGIAPPVDTEQARLDTSLTERQLEDLPVSGREVYSLVLLQPGITATLAPVISNTQFNTFNYGFSANGATARGNNFALDGISNNNEWLGGTPAISPSLEAIESFQVQTSNFSPEYGRTNGAIVAITTRSGTNAFHGSVYDYIRNPVFDAHNHFDQPDAPGSFLKQNDFGVSVGGPIIRDKTFFFFNYEGIRGVDSQTLLASGETPEYRDYVHTVRPGSIADQQLQAYPSGPCIPNTAVDTGSIFLDFLPISVAQSVPFVEFIDGAPDGIPDVCTTAHVDKRPVHGNQYSVRVDHRFTQSDLFFARFLNDSRTSDSAREELNGAAARAFTAPFTGKFPTILLSYIHLFGPNLPNDLHFTYSRSDFAIGFHAPASSSDNYPDLFFDDGFTQFGGEIFVPRNFTFNNYAIRDSIAYTRGRHALKAGFEFERLQENSNYQQETNAFYEFQDQFTFGNDVPYYTEGRVNPVTGEFVATQRHFRETNFAAFVQDDWKVTRRLTLNLGLRYDLYGVPTEAGGVLSNITLGSGATLGDQVASGVVGRVKNMFNGDHNNLSPRIGVAYDPTGSGNTAIRAGFSMAYLSPYSNLYTNASRFDPPESVVAIVFPFFNIGVPEGVTHPINYGIPAVSSPGFQVGLTPEGGIAVPGARIGVSGVQQNLKTGYSEQWFLGVQRKLFGGYYLSANYVGDVGRKLYVRNDINRFTGDQSDFSLDRFNSQWAEVFFVENSNSSNYHGLNVLMQRPFRNHYSLSVSYTLGKSMDYVSDPGLGDYSNVSIANYNGTMDLSQPKLDYGRSDFDVRHRVAINGLWEVPTPHLDGAAKEALGGWQLNGIISLQSGRPFSVWCVNVITCDYNGDGDGNDRPDVGSAGNHITGLSRSNYEKGIFTVDDFGAPAPGTNGNLGRNTFQGPGFAQVDASIFKTFTLPRDLKLQFRAEAFNLFNRVNLYLPNDILSGSQLFFGKSTVAFSPRNMQFALKLLF
jgi:outer membrane receptor protein involved in Fe transport